MAHETAELADFCDQLALLVRSNLPLPEGLLQLSCNRPTRGLSPIARQLGEQTARGEKLSSAMREHPRVFAPLHVRLVAAGEATGALAETLLAIAMLARFQQSVADGLRDILAYPMFTTLLAAGIAIYISITVIPEFHAIFSEFGAWTAIPLSSRCVLGTGMFLHRHRHVAWLLFSVCAVAGIWVLSRGKAARRTLERLAGILPGAGGALAALDAARLCRLSSVFLGQRMPLHEAVEAAAQLVQRPSASRALQRVAAGLRSGSSAADAFSGETDIDGLIALTFANAAEGSLAEELDRLSVLYEHRMALCARTARVLWTATASIMAVLAVGLVVMGMFAPLVSVVRTLGMCE